MLSLSSVVNLRILLVRPNRAMGTGQCNALLKPSSVQTNQSRRASKDMQDVEEFLKNAKIRFLEFNQVHTEQKLTRMELLLSVVSLLFFLTFAGCYLLLYRKEMGDIEIDYEKFAYRPDQVETTNVIEEEKKKTWKDHPLFKEI